MKGTCSSIDLGDDKVVSGGHFYAEILPGNDAVANLDGYGGCSAVEGESFIGEVHPASRSRCAL